MQGSTKYDNRMPLLDEQEEQEVPVSHIYKITVNGLKQIFQLNAEGQFDSSLIERHENRVLGILKKLASEQGTGIVGDEKDLKRRKKVFGENKRPSPPKASIKESIIQTISNYVWLAIAGTALLSSVVSVFFGEWREVWEGISIILVALFLIMLIAVSDYIKDNKFIELSSNIKEESVPVIRGKLGATQSISIWDVVVGDVVLLETGASVPADCLIIDAQDMQIDEPQQEGPDGQLQEQNTDVNVSQQVPWLMAGSIVKRGQCKAVVCNVGENSTRGIKERKLDTESDTELQKKLKNLQNQFIKIAAICCFIVLILIVIMLFIKITGKLPWYQVLFQQSLKYANMLVVLFVVIVPEGLPLTVGVSLAFSTGRMYTEDRILVKKLDAPEKMGEVDEILCGKTSTITTGDMKIAQFLCEDKQIKNTRKNTLLHCELSNVTLDLIKESILFNCSARIEMDSTTYVPVGNATEVGLLKFLQDADIPVHLLIQQKLGRIKAVSPFSSIKKRSATVVENPNRPGWVTIFLKGAPEVILEMCQSIQSASGVVQLSPDLSEEIRREVDAMAGKPLRVISFAYWTMEEDQWNATFEQGGKEFEQALDDKIITFTFLGAFGLKDPLRKNVKSVVNAVKQKGHVNVRMISGDHIETAKRVAYKAGILTDEDLQKPNSVMDADDFRSMVGPIEQQQIYNEDGKEEIKLVLENGERFITILEDLKVLSRANSDDKLLMVVGLKNSFKSVAVTGDGINDIEALEAADVGLAMGSGCSAAKNASSLILSGDDFESAIRAIMWGRNIYHNVGRFLQFQLTVNVSVTLLVMVGILFFGESPLSAVQLLWVNLIMDTFAAIALSTEPPMEKILRSPPTSNVSILTPVIWRQVLGVSLYNFLIMLSLFIFGRYIGGLDKFDYYGTKITTPSPDEKCTAEKKDEADKVLCGDYWAAQSKERLFTYILVTFVFLQVFNYINCRKIDKNEINVFEKIFHKVNWYFWLTIVIICVIQVLMVQWFFILTRTTPLTRSEWGACIVAGSTVLIIAALLKLTPNALLKKIPFTKFVNEDDDRKDWISDKVAQLNEQSVDLDKLKNRGKKKQVPEGYDEVAETDNNFQQAP